MPVAIKRPRANRDLLEIWDYIANDSLDRADGLIATFDRKFRMLAEQPETGRRREELAENLRSLAVGRYVIFYRPIPNGIEVVRVLHGARDLYAFFPDDD
ncbi:MAG: type II toxin-antitoxin system RelE/ParE family toxin [Methylohalobius sp. ZOD2]